MAEIEKSDIPKLNGDVDLIENSAFTLEATLERMESDEPFPDYSPSMEVAEVKREPSVEIFPAADESAQGLKRRASDSDTESPCQFFQSDNEDEQLIGFEPSVFDDCKTAIDKLQALIKRDEETLKPTKSVKRGRKWSAKRFCADTPTSRPSSGLSIKSDEHLSSTDVGSSAASSPSSFRGKRVDITLKQYRLPIELGWKRELVFRATFESGTKRNADIYYYAPDGKKLRSSREVADFIKGHKKLTVDNFTFFKEPLGLNDPEKEIIRDAKAVGQKGPPTPARTPTPAIVEGKRTPKPKTPKVATPEVTPAKIKVKSMGSRLSSGTTPASTPTSDKKKKAPAPNNNNTNWKRPSGAPPVAPAPYNAAPSTPAASQKTPPHQGVCVPVEQESPKVTGLAPCSVKCVMARGCVPDLQCARCLCLYHAVCVGLPAPPLHFICSNCEPTDANVPAPPPLTHKSQIATSPNKYQTMTTPPLPPRIPKLLPQLTKSTERNLPVPQRIPVRKNIPKKKPQEEVKRVVVKMKMSNTTSPTGKAMWTVQTEDIAPKTPPRPKLVPVKTKRQIDQPQQIIYIDGKRYIVVKKTVIHTSPGSNRSSAVKAAMLTNKPLVID